MLSLEHEMLEEILLTLRGADENASKSKGKKISHEYIDALRSDVLMVGVLLYCPYNHYRMIHKFYIYFHIRTHLLL